MIRVIMVGRLGNNLFQYAWGRAVSERHGVPLVLDGMRFNDPMWSQVGMIGRLPGFTSGTARLIRSRSLAARAFRKIAGKHHWKWTGKPLVRERHWDHGFDPQLLDVPSDCVAFGYFQSPLYFANLAATIREELNPVGLGFDDGHDGWIENLEAEGSVAVHVRRGDYVNHELFFALDEGYYRAAMDRLRECVPGARFHVFSDDPAWCRAVFRVPDTSLVVHDARLPALGVLSLMSRARHHIIANSSFSWWAAFLGQKPGQRVCYPSTWARPEVCRIPADEKGMAGWERVPVLEPALINRELRRFCL